MADILILQDAWLPQMQENFDRMYEAQERRAELDMHEGALPYGMIGYAATVRSVRKIAEICNRNHTNMRGYAWAGATMVNLGM